MVHRNTVVRSTGSGITTMRRIGLIGGMSWASTAFYYERINREVQRRMGDLNSAHLLIESVNFHDYAGLQSDDDWDAAAGLMTRSARRLAQSGATAILICSNAMHRVYEPVADAIDVPLIHIADCIGDTMRADGVESAALLGTRNVMTEGFFRERLVAKGLSLSPPDETRVGEVERIIYDELMRGQVRRDSERTLKTFITNIAKQEVEAVILACTELNMVVDTKANILPIYDSSEIHADAAVDWMLAPV